MDGKPDTGPGADNRQLNKPLVDGGTRQDLQESAREVQSQANRAAQGRERMGGMAAGARDTVHEIGSQSDSAMNGPREEIVAQVRDLGSSAGRMAESQMERGRHQVAESVHAVGEALRLGAQQVRQNDGSSNVQFLERLADPIDRVSGYLERHDTREIAHDLESFARQNEALFLGGAFALGVLGARFLSASSTDARHDSGDWSTGRRDTALVPRQDAIARPGVAGYPPPFERSTMGADGGARGPLDR